MCYQVVYIDDTLGQFSLKYLRGSEEKMQRDSNWANSCFEQKSNMEKGKRENQQRRLWNEERGRRKEEKTIRRKKERKNKTD